MGSGKCLNHQNEDKLTRVLLKITSATLKWVLWTTSFTELLEDLLMKLKLIKVMLIIMNEAIGKGSK